MRIFIVLGALLVGLSGSAVADVVQLTHGGQVTGEIVAQDRAGVDVRTAAGHVFSLPWSNVVGITEGTAMPARVLTTPVAVPVPQTPAEPVSLAANTVRNTTAPYAYAPRLTTSRRPVLAGWGGDGQFVEPVEEVAVVEEEEPPWFLDRVCAFFGF